MEMIKNSIEALDLKEMDGSLLSFAIMHGVNRMPHVDGALVAKAIELAAYLHRKQTRANRGNLPRDNYITHPLRNTLRIMRYDCVNQDIIIASILHDTVEDHPKDINREFSKTPFSTDAEARENALTYISETFGKEVARIVRAVSNPPFPSSLSKEEKRKLYAEHVLEVISDPAVFLVKFSDFVDNAVGLYHNTGSPDMVKHLSRKYIQLVFGLRHRLKYEPHLISASEQGLLEMKRHLNIGETRLQKLIED